MLRLAELTVLAGLVGKSIQQSCAAEFAQCGGQGWTGPTCCVAGTTCEVLNPFFFQCVPGTSSQGSSSTISNSAPSGTTTAPAGTTTKAPASSATGASTFTETDSTTIASHAQSPYPSIAASSCGSWTLVDNVCCPSYCANDDTSEFCSDCPCATPPSADCKSGTMWGETRHVADDPDWHFSRSTHFGLTSGGACGFGLYGLCTSSPDQWIQTDIAATCSAFCTSYPSLCQDPSGTTLRGNFAAPNGDYYTQFWPTLEGTLDNYLSCGECFQLVKTKTDGTDYAPGEDGFTEPVTLEIVDSCPCSANSKWCCGSGADHCGEIDGWTFGCPIPVDSHHMDLSDIAMGRLQGNGSLAEGVIPIRYQRVDCPKPGNVYIWLRPGAGPFFFELTAVNTNGPGSVTKIEIQSAGNDTWVEMEHDPNYTSSRPQERYGGWVIPQGSGPFNPPIAIRLTSPTGEQIVNTQGIKSFTPPADADPNFFYIDLGVQFTVN